MPTPPADTLEQPPRLDAPEENPSRLLEVLQAVTRKIISTSDLADMLSAVALIIHDRLAYEQVAVYLADPETGDLALCAAAGVAASQIQPAQYHLPAGSGTPGRAVQQDRIVRVDDFALAPEIIPAFGPAAGAAELSAPIRNTHRALGALTLASSRRGQFGPADEAQSAALAELLAVAIRSAESLRREVERAAHEALLTYLSHAVNSWLSLEDVLRQAVSEIGSCLKTDRCTLSLIDTQACTIVTEHEYVNDMLTERRSLRRREPLVEAFVRLLQSGEVVIGTEDRLSPALQEFWGELSGRYGVRSLVSIPIAGESTDSLYTLNLMQVTHPRRWSADDVELLRGIADQLSLALRHARLFDGLQQTAAELRAKNAELEAFVYTVSHDLQAPVVSLRGFAALLESRYGAALDEHGHTYVARVAANAEFLSRLLQDLLELSRVGRLEEPDESLPVWPVVEEVLGDMAQPLAERGVQIVLPQAWPTVYYSRTRLRQVFSNLLSNAVKFMGSQPEPRVEIGWRRLRVVQAGRPEARRQTDQIDFYVADNGIGIQPDYQQRIFVPFERLKEVDVEGTGVGLSIVKRIVEDRGGTIRVDSAPGAGATFYFSVPAALPAGG